LEFLSASWQRRRGHYDECLRWKPVMSEQQDGIERHPSGARKAHESIPALHPRILWRDPTKCFRILLLSSAAFTDIFAE
jgi:hypothetical protein